MAEASKKSLFFRFSKRSEDIDSEAISAFFSSIGPIRSCFQVTKDGKPAGYGFVQFAMEDDAKAAVEKLNGQKIKNALITLDFAKHRNRKDPKEKLIEVVVKKDAGDRKKLDKYVRLLERSIVVCNLPQVDKKIVYKKMRKFGQVEQIEFPQPVPDVKLVNERSIESDFKGERCALVTYATRKEAEKACKLHEHIFKGEKLKVRIHPHPIHAKVNFRLVVRNIPFELEKSALFATLNKFVCIVELTLMAGYGFVTLCCKEDCELLMKEVNGKVLDALKRPLIIDYSLSKDEFRKASDDQMKAVVTEDLDAEEPDSAINEDEFEEVKSDDEEMKKETLNRETITEEVDAFLEEATKEDHDDSDGVDVNFDQESHIAEVIDAENDEENEETSEVEEEEEKPANPQEDLELEQRCTVFVRNLSFDATEEELKDKFSEYGHVLYARLVLDKETGQSKGTAFVRFKNPEPVEKLLEQQSVNEVNVASSTYQINQLMLNGRPLFVLRTMSKDQLKTDTIVHRDKRNLYLLREMLINSSSPNFNDVSDKFKSALNDLFRARKKKLEKALQYSISKTRLSIRNLGKKIDVKSLKEIVKSAAEKYKGRLDEFHPKEQARLIEDGIKKKVVVKQVKIVEDKQGKAMGYGFVEFSEHAHALGCLRQLKEAKVPPVEGRRVVIEFAMENTVILKRREQKIAHLKQKRDAEPAASQENNQARHRESKGGKETRLDPVKPKNAKPEMKQKKQEQKKPASKYDAEPKKGFTKPQPKQQKQEKQPKQLKRKTRDEIEDEEFTSLVAKYKKRLLVQ